jgi:hypothetical protein
MKKEGHYFGQDKLAYHKRKLIIRAKDVQNFEELPTLGDVVSTNTLTEAELDAFRFLIHKFDENELVPDISQHLLNVLEIEVNLIQFRKRYQQ